ncbi:MAG TPA: sugar phosphate isomerase/epimerase family protein [Vicinamibacteria bacterium]|nr:sugar phosphate isomerase/epimerase family protein [Vicinamibacteria bacterium]
MGRTRREFIREGTTLLAGAALLADAPALRAAPAPAVKWPIGCFNRPWTKWTFDETLKAIKAAGYATTGLLTRTETDPFIAAEATPEYLDRLKRTLAASGLTANMGALRSRHDVPLEDTVKSLEKEIDHAAFLGLKYVMTFGIDEPAQFDQYFRSMARAAAYGAEKGVQVVMKPHGGSSGASDEIIAAMKKVGHSNFKIWYDAGNIIHYTGKDPVEELKPIVQYVTGFCAKDCAAPKGEVMIQFGTGKVDFAGVFKVLKSAGFGGPIMVECCAVGDTAEATAASARANREFLEKVLAAL